jgi:hypothetical protein
VGVNCNVQSRESSGGTRFHVARVGYEGCDAVKTAAPERDAVKYTPRDRNNSARLARDVAGYVDGMGTPAGEVQRAQSVTRPAVDMGAAVTQQLDDASVAAVARDVDGRNAAVVRHVTKRATAGELWERAMADDEKNAEATHTAAEALWRC